MVAPVRINVRQTVGRKNNCKLNFFSMYFVWTNEEKHLYFKNSEKYQTQALKNSIPLMWFCWLTVKFGLNTFNNVFAADFEYVCVNWSPLTYAELSILVAKFKIKINVILISGHYIALKKSKTYLYYIWITVS